MQPEIHREKPADPNSRCLTFVGRNGDGKAKERERQLLFSHAPDAPSMHTWWMSFAVFFPIIKPQLSVYGYYQFVMEKGMEGFHLGQKIDDKLGMPPSMMARLVFTVHMMHNTAWPTIKTCNIIILFTFCYCGGKGGGT